MGSCIKLHNEESQNAYPSQNIIMMMMKSRRMRWAGHVPRIAGKKLNKILVGKPEGKRPLERPQRRWEDNIRMDLREIGWEGVDRTELAQDKDQPQTPVRMI
jgi:hypothetical protein